MMLTVPFKFNVTGRMKGRQREITYEMWETIDLDIPIVSETDAPVAVVWNNTFPEDLLIDQCARDEWGPYDADGPSHTVIYDDSHWLALKLADNEWSPDPSPSGPCVFDDVAHRILETGSCPLLDLHGIDRKVRKQIEACQNDAHRLFDEVASSTRAAALRKLQRAAENLIAVENRLYRKCMEPYLWVMRGVTHRNRTTASDSYRTAVLRVSTDEKDSVTPHRIDIERRDRFSLGEVDMVLDFTNRYNEGKWLGQQVNVLNHEHKPQMLHHLCFDENAHLRKRIRQIFTQLAGEFLRITLGEIPMNTIRCIADLDARFAQLDTEEGLALFEESALRMQEYLSNPYHPQRHVDSIANDLVTLLEERNISIGGNMGTPERKQK